MKKINEILTMLEGFEKLTIIIHKIYQKDYDMYKSGVIYNLESYQKKYKYCLENCYDQIEKLILKEKKEEVVEKLKKKKEIIEEIYLKSVRYPKELRTIEKDFIVLATGTPLLYCEEIIKTIEKAIEENRGFEEEIKQMSEIYIKISLEMHEGKRKQMKEKVKDKIIKEKGVTQRLRKKKKFKFV